MKMLTVTPRCISAWHHRRRHIEVRAPRSTAAELASAQPQGELPTRPTASEIEPSIPAVDLWTTRQSMQPSAKKCYPCCRLKLLPMLPVAQNEASFHAGC